RGAAARQPGDGPEVRPRAWGVRVVAVLGGGGAKALAHLGAWRALQEAGITPVHIVATSMGSVIGAALAAGGSPDAIIAAMRGLTRKDIAAVDLLSLL